MTYPAADSINCVEKCNIYDGSTMVNSAGDACVTSCGASYKLNIDFTFELAEFYKTFNTDDL